METKLYNRKSFTIEAVRVTDENMAEVATWCRGTIEVERTDHGVKKFIRVKVRNPITDKQSKAFAGDWVMKSKHGFKVYVHKAFVNSFEECVVYTEAQAKAHLDGSDSPVEKAGTKDPEDVKEAIARADHVLSEGGSKHKYITEVGKAYKEIQEDKALEVKENIFDKEEPGLCEACLLEKPVRKVQLVGDEAQLCDGCREVVEQASVDRTEVTAREVTAREALGFTQARDEKRV